MNASHGWCLKLNSATVSTSNCPRSMTGSSRAIRRRKQRCFDTTQPIISTPKLNHPSAYAMPRIKVSRSAAIGTTTPCSTGRASTGVRRLGKSVGSMACNAVPSVWGSRELGRLGGTSDCTTRRCAEGGLAALAASEGSPGSGEAEAAGVDEGR